MDLSKTSLVIVLPFLLLTLINPILAQNSPDDFLQVHNAARAEVGVPPLEWNCTVAAYALKYAKSRAADCELEHSMGPYGENIAEGGNQFSGTDAVNMFVGEKQFYDYQSNSCVGDECLHYTQVVWRDTVHLGCARVRCAKGWWFITCNYNPPGNIDGQRPY